MQDFDVENTYRKKVVVTNVSTTTNYLRFVSVSQNFVDFISIRCAQSPLKFTKILFTLRYFTTEMSILGHLVFQTLVKNVDWMFMY